MIKATPEDRKTDVRRYTGGCAGLAPAERVSHNSHSARTQPAHNESKHHDYRERERHSGKRVGPEPGHEPRIGQVIRIHGESPGKHRKRHSHYRFQHTVFDQQSHRTCSPGKNYAAIRPKMYF
jgi:hypothetical protein